MGAAQRRNDGVAAATGDLLCFVDSDCFVFPGWLDTIVETLLSDDDIAIVAPHVAHATDYIMDKAVTMTTHLYETRDVLTTTMLLRKSLHEAVSGFDAILLSDREDLDFCLRVKHKFPESKILTDFRGFVYHPGRIDPNTGICEPHEKSTRRMPELQNEQKRKQGLWLLYKRWGIRDFFDAYPEESEEEMKNE